MTGEVMKTIKENIQNEIIIKNSKFITLLIQLNSSDIHSKLEEIKLSYPKATHYCYAYIYGKEKGCSDDKEPSRTAGLPMLNVLEKEELNNILAVTIRYFGGIKLGAGGLVRAYTKSITEALKQAEYQELIEGYRIRIEFDYSNENTINYILKDSTILEKNFDHNICYKVLINQNTLEKLKDYTYHIEEQTWIIKRM